MSLDDFCSIVKEIRNPAIEFFKNQKIGDFQMSDENFQFYNNIEVGNYFIKFKNAKNGATCEILIDYKIKEMKK